MFLDAIGRFRQNAAMEKVIYGVLERLLSSGNQGLVMTERQIIAMERALSIAVVTGISLYFKKKKYM